ncbi:hypothetical protein [Flavilitoribacter nigricans]|nr:hypothetical protein [Flavilitoribacter nigricans]
MKRRKKIYGIIGIAFSLILIYILIEKPLSIVGEYPMLAGFLTVIGFVLSAYHIVQGFVQQQKYYNYLMIAVSLLRGIGILVGGIFTGISYQHAKSDHLQKFGAIVTATLTKKKNPYLYLKGGKEEAFEIHFSFETLDGKTINGWEVVSESEFYNVGNTKTLPLIYSLKKNSVCKLILGELEKEIYSAKLKAGSSIVD